LKKPTGKRQPPKREQSPVIAGRVPASLHQQIKKAARKSGRTMSDEMAFQVALSFEWEQQRLDYLEIIKGGERLENLLAGIGWKQTRFLEGSVWTPPGIDITRLSYSLDAAAIARAMEPELTQLVARTINKMKPGGDK
jgi:hypothetical protein